jgi:hypothetical protein
VYRTASQAKDRGNLRNGYREHRRDTRVGTLAHFSEHEASSTNVVYQWVIPVKETGSDNFNTGCQP